jgi:hypothetical protein
LLLPVMAAARVMSKPWSMLPPVLTLPGSGIERVPDSIVPPVWVPLIPVMSTEPLSPSSTTVKAPLTLVEMFSRYAPGAVAVKLTV